MPASRERMLKKNAESMTPWSASSSAISPAVEPRRDHDGDRPLGVAGVVAGLRDAVGEPRGHHDEQQDEQQDQPPGAAPGAREAALARDAGGTVAPARAPAGRAADGPGRRGPRAADLRQVADRRRGDALDARGRLDVGVQLGLVLVLEGLGRDGDRLGLRLPGGLGDGLGGTS